MESTIESEKSKENSRLGRPVGSTIFTSDSFLEHAIKAYRKRASKKNDNRPTQDEVAQSLGIGRATFNRYFNSFGISWAQIRRDAMILPYELEGC
jgi:hypothetical protein